ncbi:alginate lyase family protein [Gilvimarinus sp. SDUM040013]|uniref:Alginate lyase family protein n=1 Tax=Gilvimarinus gilvus TaxID=3058038 RepID=A0ABU4RTL0_9GAMM|nr:alginate lyase family protein [Gilvimarinus sp. SDUM040013]MDO3386849.1 alginate lyase family protein [Gilvimarinus sp. SDUM040013]MDX6848221.1 alginate lyase family protein [Gilvimarinus sp. SDUM040013]
MSRAWTMRLTIVLALAATLTVLIAHKWRENGLQLTVAESEKRTWHSSAPVLPAHYIWIDRNRLLALPTEGPAWENLLTAANQPLGIPNLADQNDPTNVQVLARALVYARTGGEHLRRSVISTCMMAIGTERGGRTLDLGKELLAYVLAADLVGLEGEQEQRFRNWLSTLPEREYPSGKTLRSTHERRPNNWGTFAGSSRLAVAAYLGDKEEIARAARVFRGWLGDRTLYSGFRFKDRSWHAEPLRPRGINPVGATKQGYSIDGALPDDQRRSGGFLWPPPKENYVYTALQGALAQAVILDRAGYPVWEWEDRALLRAFRWLHVHADYPAQGDDTWLPHLINYYYSENFPAPVPSRPGKNAGWTDWTHPPGMH